MTVDWAAAAKFLLSENSDKTPLTELAKNQAFPLFMAACGWRRPGFFTPSVTFENRARPATQMSFSPNSDGKKLLSMCRHLVISSASYGYGTLWARALRPTHLLYTNIFFKRLNLTHGHEQHHCLGSRIPSRGSFLFCKNCSWQTFPWYETRSQSAHLWIFKSMPNGIPDCVNVWLCRL